jgi:hypothetical protein
MRRVGCFRWAATVVVQSKTKRSFLFARGYGTLQSRFPRHGWRNIALNSARAALKVAVKRVGVTGSHGGHLLHGLACMDLMNLDELQLLRSTSPGSWSRTGSSI